MANNTTAQQFIVSKRKFHDAWAFLLFLIVYIGSTAWTYLTAYNEKGVLELDNDLTKTLFYCFCCVGLFSFFNLACFRLIPELFIKLTICLFPAVAILPVCFNPGVWAFIFTGGILLTWAYFIYKFWKSLKYVAKVLKHGMKIVISRFSSVLVGVLFSFLLLSLQLMLVLNIDIEKLNDNGPLLAAVICSIYWYSATMVYFYKVYLTSISAYHLLNLGSLSESVFGGSIINSLYALGSVSYAGLVVAVVSTIRFFISRERNREDRRRNLLEDICLCIASVIIALLENIIKFANEITMPYIAIYGTSYVESAKKSFELIERGTGIPLIGMAAMNYCLFTISTAVSICTFAVAWLSLQVTTVSAEVIVKVLLSCTIPMMLYYLLMMVVSSSFLSLIYLHTENADLIKSSDDELYSDLETYKRMNQ